MNGRDRARDVRACRERCRPRHFRAAARRRLRRRSARRSSRDFARMRGSIRFRRRKRSRAWDESRHRAAHSYAREVRCAGRRRALFRRGFGPARPRRFVRRRRHTPWNAFGAKFDSIQALRPTSSSAHSRLSFRRITSRPASRAAAPKCSTATAACSNDSTTPRAAGRCAFAAHRFTRRCCRTVRSCWRERLTKSGWAIGNSMSGRVLWIVASFVGVIAAVAIVAPFFLSPSSRPAGPARVRRGARPDFSVANRHRRASASLAQYRGRTVVLNLWATWCPPCRAEMPELQRLAEADAGRGVVVIGVNQGESAESAARVRAIAADPLSDLDGRPAAVRTSLYRTWVADDGRRRKQRNRRPRLRRRAYVRSVTRRTLRITGVALSSFAVAAIALVAVAIVEIAAPGRAVYHAGWFNVALIASGAVAARARALATLARANCRRTRRDRRDGARCCNRGARYGRKRLAGAG